MAGAPLRLTNARIADEIDRDAALVALRPEDLALIDGWLRAAHVRSWWPHPPEDELATGQGWGPRFVRLAIRRLFAVPEIVRLQIDPDPANALSIRAYEKAGFRSAGRIQTPDGAALYMIVERKRAG